MILPGPLAAVFLPLAPAFSAPTFERFVLLAVGAILTSGCRTVANVLRTLGPLAAGHATSFQRVFSAAAWSPLAVACAVGRLVLQLLPADQPVVLVADDTVDGHAGDRVWAKARHRDAVRSTHTHLAWRWGHKWVVLAVLVRFPFARRPWALPVLVGLYRGPDDNRQAGRPHHTPAQIACRLVRLLLRWFPDRRFVLIGDAGYSTHEVARFCCRQGGRLTLVGKFHPDAALFEPPPPYSGMGRPRIKGAALPKPSVAVAAARRLSRLTVDWYGGGSRRVAYKTGTGQWNRDGRGLVPVRWVYVRQLSGTRRDEYFYSTDPRLDATRVVNYYAGRWNIEKHQADYPSSRRWVGTRRIGYHRRGGVARAGRLVPATPGRLHRRRPMSDRSRRRTAPPRA